MIIRFGVAGADIVSTHMAIEGTGSSAVYAILRFCHISAFDHCIEILEDKKMCFVNTIAKTIHDEVTR